MLGSHRRRQEALADLLQTVDISEYPDSLTLPHYIHYRMLHAVDETLRSGREYGIDFRFKGGIWLGGIALAGTRPKMNENGSWRALSVHPGVLFYPAHLSAHTHPKLNQEFLDEALRRRGGQRKITDDASAMNKIAALPSGFKCLGYLFSRHSS